MNTKTLSRKARDWKNELRDRVRPDERDNMALLAWEIVGGLIALISIGLFIKMLPEMIRYLKIERM
jgi:hypothetical protein